MKILIQPNLTKAGAARHTARVISRLSELGVACLMEEQFRFAFDGLPLAFQNRKAGLTRTGGGWAWGEEGSWQGETSLIAGNWYYFEAVRPAG